MMAIKDRGIIKWAPAFQTPEQGKFKREAERAYYHVERPTVDEYMLTEWEERICLAMEYHYTVKFKTWHDGVISTVIGEVHFIDDKARQYVVETSTGFKRVKFSEVVGVEVDVYDE